MVNENREIVKDLRRRFNKSGWELLIYYGIMNVTVSVVAVVSVVALIVQSMTATGASSAEIEQRIVDGILSNGWGYALAIAIGGVLLYLWKKKEFCLKTIWKPAKPMTFGAFFAILAIFMMGQAVSQVMTPVLEWLMGLMGISLEESIDMASGGTDTFSMFLYICLLAPISEEILFRGLILRELEPYGKKFAILASAFLFGIFHGNLVQSPYAFLVGLVLGYVTVEYNVVWAMVLHMINNLLLGDTLLRLTGTMTTLAQEIIFALVIWGCTIAAVVVLICKRRAIAAYFREGKMHPLCLKAFFTCPGVLVLTAVLLGNMLLTLLLQLIV